MNTYVHAYRQVNRQTGRKTGRWTDRQTDIHTDRQIDRQADRQADRQTDKQADRHSITDKHSERDTGAAKQIDIELDKSLSLNHNRLVYNPFQIVNVVSSLRSGQAVLNNLHEYIRTP